MYSKHSSRQPGELTGVCVRTVTVVLAFFLLFRYLFGFAYISGPSMQPTYYDNDLVIFSRIVHPDYGDVVIVYSDTLNEYVIKRVIGLPGDSIEIMDGFTYRNDLIIYEDYIIQDYEDNMIKTVVPDGRVFLMGDNRPVSLDSRSDMIATFPIENIAGIVLFAPGV